mmetsp:Transcript_24572/g.70654  ORF Transcript_24572/g.70654 Transcript_24572/m.70654 type:complete len:370 (+) Transcript_24572:95-1204(+)
MAGTSNSAPYAGMRSDIPQPRQRTPSPIRKVADQNAPPAPARDFDLDPGNIDVIYAEDEEVFRETAVRELLKVGFQRPNIYESENGLGALEHLARLQVEGHPSMPLVVLLDVRMPGMDGRECALQIQELVKKKLLRREPFVICISSIHRQVIVDEGKGNFQVVIPKPFGTDYLNEALDLLRKWWTMGHGRHLPAWKEFNPSEIDVIAADDEPVCRLSAYMAFVQAGVSDDGVKEVDDEGELLEALEEAQEKDPNRPLVVLLGKESWAQAIYAKVEASKGTAALRREPFVVCTSVNSDRIGGSAAVEHFHAFLPRTFGQSDVKWCLEFCRLWWLTRGDGPALQEDADHGEKEDASEEDSASEAASEMSED